MWNYKLKKGIVFALLALSLVLPSNAFAASGSEMVEVNGSFYEVRYDATGLDVLLLDTDDLPPTLIVLLATTDVRGTLQVTLERSFLDARAADGSDDDFLVLLDGIDTTYSESVTDVARILTIQVPSGTISVDIIGTDFELEPTMVPEQPVIPETPPEEQPETPEPVQPVPDPVCGPGTVLQNGVCVVEPVTPPVVPPPMEESVCGPGTILKDGACVIDDTCGPGTILVDGQCVLDPSARGPASSRGMVFEFIAPMVAALVITLVIVLILWAIGRAGRTTN